MADQKQDPRPEQPQPSATDGEPHQAVKDGPVESVTIDVTPNNNPGETGHKQSGLNETMNKFKKSLMDRHIRYDPLSIVFTLIVLIGGILGFALKGSQMSLYAGIVFALLLGIGTYIEGRWKFPYPLLMTLAAIAGFMGHRWYKSEKFIPSGLLTILAIIMLARHNYLLYIRGQNRREI